MTAKTAKRSIAWVSGLGITALTLVLWLACKG